MGYASIPMGPFMVPTPDPNYIDSLKRRRDCIHRMCSALEEYLSADLDASIERASIPPKPFATVDMMVDAKKQRDNIQDQIDSLMGLLDELPEAQAKYLESLQLTGLKDQLKAQDEWITKLQKQLEEDDSK